MFIIIGLGNPEEKYTKTRHNLGFRIIDLFSKKNDFPDFNYSKKFNSLISESSIKGKKIILIKPQTFMNNSGKAVKSLLDFYKSPISNIIVIHDDIDLLLGKIKVVKNRGSAGHKGIESIIKETKKKNFIRFRIGVKPQAKKTIPNVEKFVLQKFNEKEEKEIREIIERAGTAVESLTSQGLEKTMNKYNK